MLECFEQKPVPNSIKLQPMMSDRLDAWQANQPERVKNWIKATQFEAKSGRFCLIADEQGKLQQVLVGMDDANDFWSFGALPIALPEGVYQIGEGLSSHIQSLAAYAWGLGSYQFTPYKKQKPIKAKLVLPPEHEKYFVESIVTSAYLVRDLINTPTEDMGPAELAEAAIQIANEFGASSTQIIGDELLEKGYPTIHTVGRASVHAPRLVDIQWGDAKHPKLTLVGKGVCFDSGGLDIKPADGMRLMKKDMSGAAHVLGLARLIMDAKLPVRLRALIPAVENAISGDAYHPGDVITTRKGMTVEVHNTDAEGRLIMCDALFEADTEKPDLLINFSTLTGAAKVALGTDINALFSNSPDLAQQLLRYAEQEFDPLCQMPIYKPYRKLLDSTIADISNASSQPYGGAITAAIFLNEFVSATTPWAHFDMMSWNLSSRPGRSEGADMVVVRAVFKFLLEKWGSK